MEDLGSEFFGGLAITLAVASLDSIAITGAEGFVIGIGVGLVLHFVSNDGE